MTDRRIAQLRRLSKNIIVKVYREQLVECLDSIEDLIAWNKRLVEEVNSLKTQRSEIFQILKEVEKKHGYYHY